MFGRKFCLNRISLDADENFTLQSVFRCAFRYPLNKDCSTDWFFYKNRAWYIVSSCERYTNCLFIEKPCKPNWSEARLGNFMLTSFYSSDQSIECPDGQLATSKSEIIAPELPRIISFSTASVLSQLIRFVHSKLQNKVLSADRQSL